VTTSKCYDAVHVPDAVEASRRRLCGPLMARMRRCVLPIAASLWGSESMRLGWDLMRF